jgi:hypothetical protein
VTRKHDATSIFVSPRPRSERPIRPHPCRRPLALLSLRRRHLPGLRSLRSPSGPGVRRRLPGPISTPQPLHLFLHAARPPLRAIEILHASCLPWARYGARPIVRLCLGSCFRFFYCSCTFRGLLFSSPLLVPRQ